jgi:glycosyltransferase involved in cell wall biosynthesis
MKRALAIGVFNMNELKNCWIVMPVLNEEQNLGWLLPELLKCYQVLVVDNGSTDDSARIAKGAGAYVVSCDERGYGIAVQTGFNYLLNCPDTNGKTTVVIFDADGSSPFQKIPDVALPILSGAKDLVIAQRTTQERGAMPTHAKFGNWLQTFLIHFFAGYRYLDMGPMRALSLQAYRRLRMVDRTWGWNVEMQLKALYRQLRIQEVEVFYHKRRYGNSKISGSLVGSLRAGTRILYSVVFYWWQGYANERLLQFRNAKKSECPAERI